ncbi:MAG: hypothetical protein AAFR57_00515 [Pseudomonadota bacterium]
MLAFGCLYYLDVPKTGSSRIAEVLRTHLDAPYEGGVRHRPLSARYDPRRARLLSVRHPVQFYRSLFAYGCGGRGRVHARLQEAGHADLYQADQAGFHRWLEWMLDPENGAVLGHGYGAGRIADLVGFASFQVIRMGLPGSDRLIGEMETRHDVTVRFDRPAHTPHAIIRCERLEMDLLDAVRTLELPLRYGRPELKRELAKGIRRNASPLASAFDISRLPANLQGTVREREWLMWQRFGYPPARADAAA